MTSQTRAWILFSLLALIWGSSFMLISIGVKAVHPYHLVIVRTGIAALGMAVVMIATRQRIPRDFKTLGLLFLLGVGNNALPFTLITWGEQTVESGLAGVLQSTTAFFGIIVAHFAFKDERLSVQKVVGIALGFVGVLVLASRSWQDGTLVTGSLTGQLAIIGASLSYACFTALSRHLLKQNLSPVVVSGMAMFGATLAQGALIAANTTFGDLPPAIAHDIALTPFVAIIVLGVLNTFVAYLIFYEVVRVLGSGRSTMITYAVPPVSLFFGVLFLNELLDGFIIVGSLLILGGIAVVNLRAFAWLNARRKPAPVIGD